MSILLIVIHVIVCIALIMIVLLQTGKGADMGAAFGGGGSQTLFGSSGASTFLSKSTTFAAIVFMLTSLCLAYVSSDRTTTSVINDTPKPVTETTTPEQPAPGQQTEPTETPEATQQPADTQTSSPAAAEQENPATAE